ncbi:PEGA domain-containing protein [Hyalangium versicolor]|uniref:PEGA domain-containing protein n=1 Tax=Hyalangium versicolor TaxID=2861190 RepID=UPI001CCECED1|nr:PEGA domain-containing protein [Hyalangium versicolor]
MSRHSRVYRRLLAASTLLTLFTGCVSSTVIRSDPSGATVYIDGSRVGKTPYVHEDTKTVSSTTRVKLKKEGYEDFEAVIVRNEEFQLGPCIGGAFVLIPFLWVMGYKPEHHYELEPLSGVQPPPQEQQQQYEQPAEPILPSAPPPLSPPPPPPPSPGTP